MRILLVSDHYPPFIGGVQRQTRAMALELTARGHDVSVATVWQDNLPAFEDKDGFPVHRLRQLRSARLIAGKPRRRYQPPFPDPVSAFALRRLISRFRPDVVHASGWFAYAAAAALIGKSTPLLVSAREYGFSCANASMLHKGSPCSGPGLAKCTDCSKWYYESLPRGVVAVAGVFLSKPLLRRKVRGVHSVSHYVRDVVNRDVLRAKEQARVDQVVIPSFRIPADEEPDRELLERLPDEPYIMFVGALRRVKGVQTLYDAYRQLRNAPPLVMLGTFESDTPQDPPPGVLTVGAGNNATVLAAWDRAMLGVMPSLWPEPFGSVIHEAMSRGCAVIGTTPGGHEDMIEDGRTGLLVPPADVEALRDAMQRLIDSPDERSAMGHMGKERAGAFTAPVAIPQFEAFYETAVTR